MQLNKRKLLNGTIKSLIGLLLAWAIYEQVFARREAGELWDAFVQHFTFPGLFWLLLVILLAPVNISFEALKWQQLIRGFTRLPFRKVFAAILAGGTIAIFTPNRVGEYGGRILFVEAEHNWKAVIATMVGSLAQLLVLLSVGLLGAVWFSWQFMQPAAYVLPMMLCLGSVLTGLLVFGFFNIDLLIPLAKRIPFIYRFERWFKHLLVLRNYTSRELATALLFAFARYMTYTFQYYFLLRFFDIPVSLLNGLTGIVSIFFVQASIPLPPLMGLLARGEIALFVWGMFSDDQVGILAASFGLFVINLAIPALIGMVFIIQTNILKTLGFEK